jgi:transcriptional regulator with GAF, ATPase, and Fis domain
VLITGETGTGKEAVAEALVQASLRASQPFVVIDCSALPQNLIESELLGHVKGAFTGATSDYRGAFERADGGTIFLDEIGELPLELQPKLLRVLERREVRRIGAERTRTIDVRVIAATNRVLATEVNERRFRQDLYYRLSVVNMSHPAAARATRRHPAAHRALLSAALGWLPGTDAGRDHRAALRQRLHLAGQCSRAAQCHRAGLSCTGRRSDWGRGDCRSAEKRPRPLPIEVDLAVPFKTAKQKLVDAFEKEYLQAMLKATRGNISEAARRAQIDRMHLYKLITQHHLNPSE